MTIRIKEITFYIAWILYIFNYIIFEQSQFKFMTFKSSVSQIIKILVIILLIITVCYKKKIRVKALIVVLSTFLLFLFSFVLTESWSILFWVMFSLAAFENIDYKQFIKVDFIIRTTLYVFVLFCVFFGFLKNNSYIIYDREKVDLGYVHYNMFGMNMGVLMTEIIILYKDIKKSKYVIYIFGITLCLVQIPVGVGRTGIYASILILSVSLLIENGMILYLIKKYKLFFSINPFVLAIISFIVSYLYDSKNPLMSFLNKISSTRIAFSKLFLIEYNLSIFGQKIYINNDVTNGSYAALDMGYIRVGIEYGVLILFILLFTLTIIQIKSIESNCFGLYLAALYFTITLVSASSVINIANNWLLVFTFQAFVGKLFTKSKPVSLN